jgi:hypothetical protein
VLGQDADIVLLSLSLISHRIRQLSNRLFLPTSCCPHLVPSPCCSIAALFADVRVQVKHQFAHRQHLIEEAKKAYAAKLVAEKAGGAKEGESSRDWETWLALLGWDVWVWSRRERYEQAGETHGAKRRRYSRTGEAGFGGSVAFWSGQCLQSAARVRGLAQRPLYVLSMVSPSHSLDSLSPLAPSCPPLVLLCRLLPPSPSGCGPLLGLSHRSRVRHKALGFSLTLSPVITNIDDPKFDLEKLLEAWTQGA